MQLGGKLRKKERNLLGNMMEISEKMLIRVIANIF